MPEREEKLSRFERIALIHLLEIRKHIEGTDEFDDAIVILEKGFETLYDEAGLARLYEPLSLEKSSFVYDVLSLYDAAYWYRSQHPGDKEAGDLPFVKFHGFDGNNEGEYLGFAHFLMKTKKQFSTVAENEKDSDHFNSHAPSVPLYTRLLKAQRRHMSQEHGFTAETLRAVFCDEVVREPRK